MSESKTLKGAPFPLTAKTSLPEVELKLFFTLCPSILSNNFSQIGHDINVQPLLVLLLLIPCTPPLRTLPSLVESS